jgi:pyridoxamine 5'-phosphate oxidase
MSLPVADLPYHYRMSEPRELLPDPLPAQPLELVVAWVAEAARRGLQPNPGAMVLATVDARGRPSARVVLCKDIRPQPGYLTFFTNYRSRKGRELAANPYAAVVLHWDALHRQVRIEGRIVPASAAESDAYFATRAWRSQLGAWASEQSEPVASRASLQEAVAETARRLRVPPPDSAAEAAVPIARPPHWGGYHLWADAVELWTEGAARIHDRARWTRTLSGAADAPRAGPWAAIRLQP